MGWLIAGILLVILLRTRHRLKALTKLAFLSLSPEANSHPEGSPHPEASGSSSHRQVYELSVLRLELGRMRAGETITATHCAELTESIDATLSTVVQQSWAAPRSIAWAKSRDAAWALLRQHEATLPAQPPWHREVEPTGVAARELAPPAHLSDDMSQPVAMPSLSMAAKVAVASAPSVVPPPDVVAPPMPVPAPLASESPSYRGVAAEAEATSGYAIAPTPPSPVERALQAVSGWPALLIPFMAQNIGWFLGGFCFVAGSVFLVSYTTGFAKSLTLFTVLFAYTLLVLWAGYQLCRRRPALIASSRVLMTIGALLVPLNIAAAVRLILTGLPDPGSVALGLLAVALSLGGLYYAMVLVSGMVERTLQDRHPQLFLALAAMQLTVPLLTFWPSWLVLALLHTMLLGLLIYGLVRFMQDWLHAIFIEHRTTTYYAAGTLVYAALVSFVHLTWGYPGPQVTPPGYYGPFLMVLCGVLFYVDAQLKQWMKRDTFLSRLSFAIYGLSILALFAAVGAPVAHGFTLVLSIVLYATVMWQYATLPPFYLLLGCSGWLYHTVILSRVPFAGYFLASVPGLAALLWWSWRALRFQSPALAQMSYRIWVVAVVALAAWSMGHAEPGLLAMVTSLLVMALAFLGPYALPAPLFGSFRLRWPGRQGDSTAPSEVSSHGPQAAWGYAGMFAAVVTAAYTPLWLGLAWATQFAGGVLLLAQLWTLIGLRHLRQPRSTPPAVTPGREMWCNGALLTVGLFLLVVVGFWGAELTAHRALPILLALGGGVLLQISWGLGIQWLVYGVLLFWGAAGITVKLTYFPESGSGTTAFSVALAVWAMLWWVERKPPEVMAILREQAELRTQTEPPLALFWYWPASFRPYPDIICRPLQHAMLLLGVVGLLQYGRHLLTGGLGWSGVISASVGAVLALLVTGRYRWVRLFPLAIGLGLGSGIGLAYTLGVTTSAGLSLVGTLSALGVWRVGLWLLSHALVSRSCRLLRLGGDRDVLEPTIYGSACVITCLSLIVPLGQHGLFTPHLALLGSLVASMVFLWLSGQYYRRRVHVYLLLGMGVFSTVLVYLWSVYTGSTLPTTGWATLLTDPGFGVIVVLVGLALWGITWAITKRLVSQAVEDVSLDLAQYVYLTPLRIAAVGLALAAVGQQLGLAWLASVGVPDMSQIVSVGVLGLAGVTLLLANHGLGKPSISFVGILGGVLALLWGQGLEVHGSPVCSVGLLAPNCVDQWFTLTLIAAGGAVLARYISREPRWERLYSQPLCLAAAVTYSWALLGAVVLFSTVSIWAVASLPWLLLVLSIGLIPVVYRLPRAATVRGCGIGLLLTGSVVRALAIDDWGAVDWWLLIGWAFALWGLGNFALPRSNARWPHWSIAPGAWPWFGLGVLGIFFAGRLGHWRFEFWDEPLQLGGYLTASALYMFLMLRNSRWSGMPWSAVLALLGAGVAYNLAWAELPASTFVLYGGLGIVGWLNILLWGASWWRRYGSAVTARLAWHEHDLSRPLLMWPLAGLQLGLLGLAALETGTILWSASVATLVPWVSVAVIGVALTLSCVHRLRLQCDALSGHTAIASGLCTLLAAWLGVAVGLDITVWGLHLPLFLSLWSALLLAVQREWGTIRWRIPGLDVIRQPVSRWLLWSPPAAIAALGVFPPVALGEWLLILGIFGGVSACIGWQRRQAGWLFVAMSALVVQLHAVWLFWIPISQIPRLMPGYALQLAGLMWVAGWLRNRVARPEVGQSLYWQQLLLAAFALCTWMWHGFQVLAHLLGQPAPPWRWESGETGLAIAAALLLIACGIGQIKRTRRAAWVYSVAAFSGLLGLYIRLVWLGLAPVQVWDTAALIGAAYALFALQRLTQVRSILHLVMVLPILALGTVPFQLTSPHATGALLTVGMLYLGTRRVTDHVLPFYLGMTALNVGIYLWVPSWAHHAHLGQLYIIPAAMSVLWLLHFHRRDVKSAVLHSVRLATVSLLYASAASDVFLRANVMVFIGALGLSLGGVIVGIALRTRAFLYAGVAFFVLNVSGQLFLLFPEQRLGKAIVLLTLGTGITGTMIWFNARRESILQRIRLVRSDLAEWE